MGTEVHLTLLQVVPGLMPESRVFLGVNLRTAKDTDSIRNMQQLEAFRNSAFHIDNR